MRNWILPENISDVLPGEARQLESLRRSMLDLFGRYGYEQVIPPLVEYVESLFTQEDKALDLKTFKLVDELTGRQMGLRADITPQVARIDAHILNRKGVTRLCYSGSVVNTRPDGLLSSREPRQIGAEIYGCAGLAADVEVIELMLESLALAGLSGVRLEIGHMGIFYALAEAAGFDAHQSEEIFTALQQKDLPSLKAAVAGLPAELQAAFLVLPNCYGADGVLALARREMPAIPAVSTALDVLDALNAALRVRGITARFDLAELRSSYYHTGLVFAVYAPDFANAVARGGRYDSVGEKFGRPRPATGFSLDLRELSHLPYPNRRLGIIAPAEDDPALLQKVRELRAQGETVVVDLGLLAEESGCDRRLVRAGEGWRVEALY